MCMVYTNCLTICIVIVIYKKTNKQIDYSIFITEKCKHGKIKIQLSWIFLILQRNVINWHVWMV